MTSLPFKKVPTRMPEFEAVLSFFFSLPDNKRSLYPKFRLPMHQKFRVIRMGQKEAEGSRDQVE